MTPPVFKLAAAAANTVLAIGVGVRPFLDGQPNVGVDPSPSPSAAPASTAVPEALRYTWISGPPADPTATSYMDVNLQVKDDALQIWTSDGFQLGNQATAAEPGQLDLGSIQRGRRL